MFGGMFFDFCQESGYESILQVLGATPRDFLQNLDALHDHLSSIYPGMRAPSFRCTERPNDGALILHYYSEREGLESIVIGIVKVRKIQFNSIFNYVKSYARIARNKLNLILCFFFIEKCFITKYCYN
jgi:hypothetical protein